MGKKPDFKHHEIYFRILQNIFYKTTLCTEKKHKFDIRDKI